MFLDIAWRDVHRRSGHDVYADFEITVSLMHRMADIELLHGSLSSIPLNELVPQSFETSAGLSLEHAKVCLKRQNSLPSPAPSGFRKQHHVFTHIKDMDAERQRPQQTMSVRGLSSSAFGASVRFVIILLWSPAVPGSDVNRHFI
jgi:hypothetical protein